MQSENIFYKFDEKTSIYQKYMDNIIKYLIQKFIP